MIFPKTINLKALLIIGICSVLLSSCMMNVHSADRAVMLDENELEGLSYASVNMGGGITPEFNLGLGLGARYGLTDRCTFGLSADINYNSTKRDWVENLLYGQVAIEQKFSLVKDILAIKFKEGVYFNNYFGTVEEDPVTGLYSFTSRETVIPYLGGGLYLSPEGRKDQNWQITFGLNGNLGLREGHMPSTVGGTVQFDYFGQKEKFLTGFEIGGGIQTLVKDGSVGYLSLGIFFSKFKRTTPRPDLEY